MLEVADVRHGDVLEDVVIDEQAVLVLVGSGGIFLKGFVMARDGRVFVIGERFKRRRVPFEGPNVVGYNILYTTTDVLLANIAVAKCVRSN